MKTFWDIQNIESMEVGNWQDSIGEEEQDFKGDTFSAWVDGVSINLNGESYKKSSFGGSV